MRRINGISNHSILEELKTFPLQAVIFGIIENNNSGQIFELADKSIFIIETGSNEPFGFVAGELTQQGVDEIIHYVSQYDYPAIYTNPRYHSWFLKKGYDFLLRAEMHLEKSLLPDSKPTTYKIEPIQTLELFEQTLSFKDTLGRYGTFEHFLKLGKGYVLRHHEKILSEAYADYIGRGFMEIGVITHSEYRGQGLGMLVVSKLLQQHHLVPIWSCHIHNRASMSLAIKLGFSLSNYYMLMVPKVGNTLGDPLLEWIASEV